VRTILESKINISSLNSMLIFIKKFSVSVNLAAAHLLPVIESYIVFFISNVCVESSVPSPQQKSRALKFSKS
jgi:hypothetical protein